MNEKNFLYQYQIFRAVRLKNGSLKYARLYDGFVRFGKHRAEVGSLSVSY